MCRITKEFLLFFRNEFGICNFKLWQKNKTPEIFLNTMFYRRGISISKQILNLEHVRRNLKLEIRNLRIVYPHLNQVSSIPSPPSPTFLSFIFSSFLNQSSPRKTLNKKKRRKSSTKSILQLVLHAKLTLNF